ncbi:MAG TPA: isoprenylcysteine carboxylmethyltransferase family protein [Hyphomicrobiaceae bacterium]|nr:isoprenylcysteine carboxylmethyltransferase family protein [Hyphomicrobiaceae bacterium]
MTSIYTTVAYAAWGLILLVWIPGSFMSAKAVRRGRPLLQVFTTSLIALAFFLLFQRRSSGLLGRRLTEVSAPVALFADLVCLGAVAFAIWARLTLGRNWSGALAAVGENHELIVRGPYRYLRHPIYASFLIAMLATATTIGTLASYLAVPVGLLAFLLRIRIEEALMLSQFPDDYRAYRRQTPALIPGIF